MQLGCRKLAPVLCCRILSATLSLTVAASGQGPNIFTILGIHGWRWVLCSSEIYKKTKLKRHAFVSGWSWTTVCCTRQRHLSQIVGPLSCSPG